VSFSPAGFEGANCHVVERTMAGNLKGPRVTPRQYPARKQESQSYNHKQLNSALEEDLSPREITAPAVTWILAQ